MFQSVLSHKLCNTHSSTGFIHAISVLSMAACCALFVLLSLLSPLLKLDMQQQQQQKSFWKNESATLI